MASFTMQRWCSLQGKHTSPAWRPCWPHAVIVCSFRAPHPETPQATWNGGNPSSGELPCPKLFSNLSDLLITRPTKTRAQALGWPSRSAQDGECGGWQPDGSPREGTSSGQRRSDSSCSQSIYAYYQKRANTLKSTGTITESLRDGGRGAAETYQPTASSGTSTSYREIATALYTRGTSRVDRTPPTCPHAANTLPPHYSFVDCRRPPNSGLSSLTPTQIDTARTAAIQGLMQRCFPTSVQPDHKSKGVRQWKAPDTRKHPLPIPPPPTATASRPALYPQNLTPIPSALRPHCLARDRLRMSRTKVLVRDGPIQRHLVQEKQVQDMSLWFPAGVGPDGPWEIHVVTLQFQSPEVWERIQPSMRKLYHNGMIR